MRLCHVLSFVLVASMLVACSNAIAPQRGNPTSAATPVGSHPDRDYVIPRSLKEEVGRAQLVVIGQITGPGEVVNMARDASDATKPAPDTFAVGQVYHFQVQQYVKGSGPDLLNMVQIEGQVFGDPATITAEDIQHAKMNSPYEKTQFQPGTTYLFMLQPLEGFDHYFTGGVHPWKFVVEDDGSMTMDAPDEVRSQLPADFIPNPDAPLLPQIKELVQTEQNAKP